MATPSQNQHRATSLVHSAAIHNTHSTKGSATLANGDGCIVRGNERNQKSEQLGRRGELQPMPRLKPKNNFHTSTDIKCCSQRELTNYSFQPFLTVPVRSSTSDRLVSPARFTWPLALPVPSIESCIHKSQSAPLNIISASCRYSQHTQYQRKYDIGKWRRMHRSRTPTKSESGTPWLARRAATDYSKAKSKEQLLHRH